MPGKSKCEGLQAKAQSDSNITGLILGGSRGKGLVVEASDWDVVLYLRFGFKPWLGVKEARDRWGSDVAAPGCSG